MKEMKRKNMKGVVGFPSSMVHIHLPFEPISRVSGFKMMRREIPGGQEMEWSQKWGEDEELCEEKKVTRLTQERQDRGAKDESSNGTNNGPSPGDWGRIDILVPQKETRGTPSARF